MAASRILLNGSTNGKGVLIAATATAGTTIHTAITGTTQMDRLFIGFSNLHTSAVTLTIEWGGVTDPDNLLVKAYSMAAASSVEWLVWDAPIQNSLIVAAFASVANKIIATGYGLRGP